MDNQRLFLFIALSFIGLLLFQAWQQDYGPRPTAGSAPTEAVQPAQPDAAAPAVPADVPSAPDMPKAETPTAGGDVGALPSSQRVHVRTDVLDVELDTLGAGVRQLDLLEHTVSVDDETPFRLMSDRGPRLYVAQSGFSTTAGEAPDHTSVYTVEKTEYQLENGRDNLQVHFYWTSPSGVRVTKTFTFHRGAYNIDVAYRVENQSHSDWQGSFYRQLQRTQVSQDSSYFIYTYTGGAIYTPENRYEKISFEDMQEQNLRRPNVEGGWAAMLQHYFVGAWVPPQDNTNTFYSLNPNARYSLGLQSPLVAIPAGGERVFASTLYAGPKIQDRLEELAPGLELVVDYGILTVISKPLFWLLKMFHNLTGNWGWAIILLTLMVKIAFYKLSETSYRSMAKMRKVQPRMQALKERYGDDRQRMNQALMDLYKTEKINPLGGCLPIVIQIPVFIALYWVLLESVEMRHAPFVLWINDLSSPDPFFVLPLVMGVTMFLQQKLNPAPLDPLQQKIMMSLPVVFTVFFAFFPAGLVLYWVVNNTLSIAQQWVITKRVEQGKR